MSEVLKYIQQYYVYHCHVDGVLKYIGMGKGNRYKHCYSGTSSCSELNKDFHEGKEITVTKIKEKMTRNDAQLLEMSQILSHEGLYNKRREIDYTQIPDVKRSSKYKILGSLQQNENRHERRTAAFRRTALSNDPCRVARLRRRMRRRSDVSG